MSEAYITTWKNALAKATRPISVWTRIRLWFKRCHISHDPATGYAVRFKHLGKRMYILADSEKTNTKRA